MPYVNRSGSVTLYSDGKYGGWSQLYHADDLLRGTCSTSSVPANPPPGIDPAAPIVKTLIAMGCQPAGGGTNSQCSRIAGADGQVLPGPLWRASNRPIVFAPPGLQACQGLPRGPSCAER